MTSSSCTNWSRGSKPKIAGTTRQLAAPWQIGVMMSVPSTLEKRSSDDASRAGCPRRSRGGSPRPRAATARRACAARARARRLLAEPDRVLDASRRRRASTTSRRRCAPGCPAAPAAASRFIVPMTLISCIVRPLHLRRVDDEERVQDRVDLRSPARCGRGSSSSRRRARTRCARAATVGSSRVEADDHLDVGVALERLRDAAAPEGAEPGDEDAHRPHRSAEPDATARCAACRRAPPGSAARMSSASSITRLFE